MHRTVHAVYHGERERVQQLHAAWEQHEHSAEGTAQHELITGMLKLLQVAHTEAQAQSR